jgi:hypothetical protein
MTDKKISQLPVATSISGSDIFPIVAGAISKQVTITKLLELLVPSLVKWYVDNGSPSNTLGNNGDLYLDSLNADIYQKSAGSWGSPLLNIQGLQGDPGPTGSTGATGNMGPAGSNGINGSVWRSDTGTPSNGLGIDGDYYLNTSTGDVYYKSSGVYAVITNISGPQGPQGLQGDQGPAGADGDVGPQGPQGDPGTVPQILYAGKLTGVQWTYVNNSSFSEFTINTGAALTTEHNTNFGTVVKESTGLPGIEFTPAETGMYEVEIMCHWSGAGTSYRVELEAISNSDTIGSNVGVFWSGISNTIQGGLSLKGFLNITSLTSRNLRLRCRNTGTGTVLLNPNSPINGVQFRIRKLF